MATDQPTGRLFRSMRADDATSPEAIVALDVDEAVGLASVSLTRSATPSVDPDFAHLFAPAESGRPSDTSDPVPPPASPDREVEAGVAQESRRGETERPRARRSNPARNAEREAAMHDGIGAWGTVLVVVATTVLAGVADYVVTGSLGWVTGIALVLASGYAAMSVRPVDGFWALVSPPIAFFIVTVTVGQLTVTGGSFLVRQGLLIPFTLGRNAVWIIAATAISGIIVVMRRRRILQAYRR